MKTYKKDSLKSHIINDTLRTNVEGGHLTIADGKVADQVHSLLVTNTMSHFLVGAYRLQTMWESNRDESIFSEEEIAEVQRMAEELAETSRKMHEITKKAFAAGDKAGLPFFR